MPTTDQLQTEINALTARVNSIDGVNLPVGVVSNLATLQATDQGIIRDLRQSLLVIQQQLNTNKQLLEALTTLVNTKLGV